MFVFSIFYRVFKFVVFLLFCRLSVCVFSSLFQSCPSSPPVGLFSLVLLLNYFLSSLRTAGLSNESLGMCCDALFPPVSCFLLLGILSFALGLVLCECPALCYGASCRRSFAPGSRAESLVTSAGEYLNDARQSV